MIIVKLMGGLGNQMFQYAAGRALSLRLNTELKLDVKSLMDRTPRPDFTFRDYELDVFNIESRLASDEEIRVFISERQGIGFKIMQRLGMTVVIKESKHKFRKRVLNTSGDAYLWGYWQNEEYFKKIEDQLRIDFTLKPEFCSTFQKDFKNEVNACNSVALHVRRGDYISSDVINRQHGSCSPLYYSDAVQYIKDNINNPIIYVFSDDLKWAENNLDFKLPIKFVEVPNENRSFEDLYLMSMCKHNIIANSSYSWWAAWLNQYEKKIVIAPSRWFTNEKENNRRLKSLPEDWVVL